ncbi:hypothetical protein ACPUEN_07575 [Algoriphagus yeomjeoni]|uniref:hypothetical protein n=1 Tax=Algoriphagus yeomjeoni TaxID=291403 RepID=UPI003CE4A6EE
MSKTLTSLTSLSLLLILLGINRGFDFSDEGLYALLAVPNQENLAGVFNYDLLFKLFYKFTGIEFGLIGLRLLRLFLYFLAAGALTFFWGNLTGTKKFSVNHFLIVALGLFAGYGFLPQTLSYNSLAVVFTCFWLAVISTQKNNVLQYLFLGFMLACLAYIKITACLGLGLLTLLRMGYSKEIKVKYLLGLIIPYIMIELLMYMAIGDFAFSRMLDAKELIGSRSSYAILSLAKYELVGGFWLALAAIPFLIAGFLRHSFSKLKYILLLIGVFALSYLTYITAITEEWNHVVLLVTVALFAYVAPRFRFTTISRNQRFLFLTLLILPFVLHFGSNVYWLRLGIHFWVFWILAILFVFDKIQLKGKKVINAGVGALSFLLVLNGIWIHPFEQEPLWNATEEWNYGNGNNILLSEKQIDLLNSIRPYAEDKNQVLAVYRIPGIPYLLDKTSPKSPGFWDRSQIAYYFPQDFQTDLLIYYSLDSLPSFVQNGFSTEYAQLPDGNEIQILWRK